MKYLYHTYRSAVSLLLLCSLYSAHAQTESDVKFVDSVMAGMSLEDKIGQLFIIRAHSDLGDDHIRSVMQQIETYGVGGLCFFQGTPAKQMELTNQYQKASKIPLMVTVDAEWGLGMRLKEHALSFPRQLMLGAIQSETDIEAMGYAIGRQLKAMGVHVSFSPVADVNVNPLNPVIGDRSFGEDKENVARKSIAYAKGLEAAGVMACGKHFPGHGDTFLDSHLDLPEIGHDMVRLKEVELYPFQRMIDAGLPSMMVAHLHVPAIDNTPHVSTTLSRKAVTDLLRKEMHFEGLIFTDGLEMKGVTKHFEADEIAVMAIGAGNDMLLLSSDIKKAVSGLKAAYKSGDLSKAELDVIVRRILMAKLRYGVFAKSTLDPNQASLIAFDKEGIGIKQLLVEHAITVVRNQQAMIPMVNLTKPRTATVSFGVSGATSFEDRIDSYMQADHYRVRYHASDLDVPGFLRDLRKYDRVIIALHGMNNKVADQYGLSKAALGLIQQINRQNTIVLVMFGNPYALQYFENIGHIVCAYEDNATTNDIAAQGLVGVFGFKGRLPVTASPLFPVSSGFSTLSLQRLGYSVPERVGMVSDSLDGIKDIVRQMMHLRAAPGCQILIARHGRIVYSTSFGHPTYQDTTKVQHDDVYDIASITKVIASTPVFLRLLDEGVLSLDATLGDYVPWLRDTNKSKMRMEKVLAHHAGLQSWIRFYEKTASVDSDGMMYMAPDAYCDLPTSQHAIPIADDMYLDVMYLDTIREMIRQSGLNADGRYVYSDLGFIMLPEIVRRLTGVPFERFVDSVFYQSLGLTHMGYRPLNRMEKNKIMPSEIDTYWRCQELRGHVHDMAAAMMGGVSGNAGVFSNAKDVAIFFQMLMNGGEYGGVTYLDSNLIKKFTKRFENSTRRGLGFDMKELNPDKTQLTSKYSSPSTYGHTGFTGTCVWNDPETGLLYVFLSNRTYPKMGNDMLRRLNIRERIHSRAYRAIQGYVPYHPMHLHG